MKTLLCLNNDIWSYIFYVKIKNILPDHGLLLSQSSSIIAREMSSFENFLNNTVTPYWQPIDIVEKINTPHYKKMTGDYDLILSLRFLKIFDDEFCKIPKYGIINIHSGILPYYRGVWATFWSMLNLENNHGFCIHYIEDRKIDSGAIIENVTLSDKYLNPSSMANILLHKYLNAAEKIIPILNRIKKGEYIESLDMESKGNYYSTPSKNDLEKFKQNGFQFYSSEDKSLILENLNLSIM